MCVYVEGSSHYPAHKSSIIQLMIMITVILGRFVKDRESRLVFFSFEQLLSQKISDTTPQLTFKSQEPLIVHDCCQLPGFR